MLRCIQLAKNGLGTTYPNPMVGCIIVHDDQIIGEGYTSAYGGPHAEVNAISAVRNKSLLRNATLYATLEPCSHFGMTPPCTDMILANNIRKVVIGIVDPNDKVAGNGREKLKQGGCEVITGVLEDACKEHHKRFLTFHQKKRPYIILKWAETSDGFIAPDKNLRKTNTGPFWITNENSRQLVHKWRSEEQSILVGTRTVLIDDPKLDVRHWAGSSPNRIILDKELKLKKNLHVFDKSIRTIVFTGTDDAARFLENIEYEVIDFSKNVASNICDVLHRKNILSVLIEGGAQTLKTFIDENLWDEARIFTGCGNFGSGTRAPKLNGTLKNSMKIGSDRLNYYLND